MTVHMAEATAPIPETVSESGTGQKDPVPKRIALVATVVSVVAFFWFKHLGETLLYQDAISHMQIARRVVDSPTASYTQLGGVWLPLQHVLMLPFIRINPLYYSGFAGAVISMGAYVFTSVTLYKTGYHLSGNKLAGVATSVVFMASANILYMQSTPMSELLLFACISAMVYGVQRWIQTDKAWPYLALACIGGFCGVATRYEAWVLSFFMAGVVAFAAWRKGYGYGRGEGAVLAFSAGPVVAILLWIGYCQATFHDALYWYNGPYAKPSLWVNAHEPAVGNWLVSAKAYGYAMADDLLLPVIVLMIVGLLALLIRGRLKAETLPALSLLVFIPFFVFSLESGQRPLHVTQINGNLYNVRFGLLMIIPASIYIGYLVGLFKNRSYQLIAATIVFGAAAYGLAQVPAGHIVTEREAASFSTGNIVDQKAAGNYLRQHYDGGLILEQFFGNENILFQAHINLVNNVYEGSYRLWQPALHDPTGRRIQWIVMKQADTDQVYAALHGSTELAGYQLVYDRSDYLIYERRG